MEEDFFDIVLFRICALLLLIFSIGAFFFFETGHLAILSMLMLSLYFVAVGWGKLKRSNLLYISCQIMMFFSFIYVKGFNFPIIISVLIILSALSYLHYCIID